MSQARVLVVEDDAAMRELLGETLGRRGLGVTLLATADEAWAYLAEHEVEVVLSDINLPGMSGLSLCERIAANRPDIPVVVLTAFGSMETAVGAIRAGAWDFVTKPVDLGALGLVVDRAVTHRRLQEEVKRLRQSAARATPAVVLGNSPAIQRVFELVDRVADSDTTVLITGESGTGKEVVARTLHERGPRAARPFVAVNCAAMPEALLESELFGHVKGAFTDARTARAGLFVQAAGGTLFLDEVGELPLGLQPKLLRALQERRIRAVGSDAETPFEARVVAATNRDLERAVEEGRFREDLYYRLNVINLELPPLRARGEDVLQLAQHFLERISARTGRQVRGLSPQVAERLLNYAWPGNVRELQNCMERAVALARYETVSVEDLPEKVQRYRSSWVLPEAMDVHSLVTLEEVERRYILRVLAAVGGSKTLAARTLGLDRKTLYRKLEKYGPADPER